MRKLLCALLMAVGMTVAPAAAEEIATAAKSCVVMDADTGRVLLWHNADTPLPMASTTKIMTALVALENAALDENVTAGRNAFGVPGTSIYLDLGECLTMEQMLHGLMLSSGNDAAVAIAEHVGGTVDEFCRMMTQRAAELGCTDTVFLTPHGLPQEGHYTTARDLALITREAMRHETFRAIVSTQRATIPWQGRDYDRVLTNKNRLLAEYDGAMGVKTGYTRAAGRCLVTAAERDGVRLICVVLNCWDWFEESARLLDCAFARWERIDMLQKGECIREIPVAGSGGSACRAVLADDLSGLAEDGDLPSLEIDLPAELTAPIHAGTVLGEVRLVCGGATVGSSPLIAEADVREETYRTHIERIVQLWR